MRRPLIPPWTYLALCVLLLATGVLSQLEIRSSSRPRGSAADLARLRERDDLNLLFVLIDTLRAGRLGSYGYERPTSAALDGLAHSGVRFARVEAQSTWTKCSMASLWSGFTPARTGVTRFADALPAEATLAVERLREAGFRTTGIWRNGWVANNFGFDQGFELYLRPAPSRTPERFERRSPGSHPLAGSDWDATEVALEVMRAQAQERFFLYVHYMDVHQYLYDDAASAEEFGTSYSDAYDSAIHWVDRNVGRLLHELRELGLTRNTLVVVASDHGEGFYEHGREFHARTLYREVTEVPLILGLPFRLEPGIAVEPLVRNIDIWPTVLDLLGLPPLEGVERRSLLPLIEATADGATPAIAGSDGQPAALAYLDRTWGRPQREPDPLVSVRHGPFRLLYRTAAPEYVELYDHREDPWEQIDLAANDPEKVSELRQLGEAQLNLGVPWGTVPQIAIDELKRGQLRALGYVVDE